MWLLNPYWYTRQYSAPVSDYLDRVIAADVAAGNLLGLEDATKTAYATFIDNLIVDGYLGVTGGTISQASSVIKASPIMAGARTLAGALVPLVGTAPTNFNFVTGDYNRKTGVAGSSTNNTKYLDANRNQNADPESNRHYAVYASELPTGTQQVFPLIAAFSSPTDRSLSQFVAQRTGPGSGPVDTFFFRFSQTATATVNIMPATGLMGLAKTSATSVSLRSNNASTPLTIANSAAPASEPTLVFTRNFTGSYSSGRLAFYSIGESLNLALLDARVTTLINAFAAAIP